MKNYIILFFFITPFLSNGQSEHRLLIDPRYARGGTISQIADELTFIPMETTKESTFGIIQKMQSSKSNLVFYDVTTQAIFVFFKDGRFRSKISKLPDLSTEAIRHYSSIENFAINPYSESIYVVYDLEDRTQGKQLAIFNPDGQMLELHKLGSQFNGLSNSFSFVDSTTTLFSAKRGNKMSVYSLYRVKNFEKIDAGFVPLKSNDVFNKSWANDYQVQARIGNKSIWNRLYENKVVFFNSSTAYDVFNILLPADQVLDKEFYEDTNIISDRINTNEYLSNHKDKVSYLANFQKINNWLSFSFVRYNMSGPKDVYLFNFKSSELFNLGKITADKYSYSIPIFTSGLLVVGSEDNYLYLSIPSYLLYNALKNSTSKEWKTNTALSNYFNTQNAKSNPVLIRLKLNRRFG